ncbi:hypothetical protein Tco_1108342 [Tanacetum coccineum]
MLIIIDRKRFRKEKKDDEIEIEKKMMMLRRRMRLLRERNKKKRFALGLYRFLRMRRMQTTIPNTSNNTLGTDLSSDKTISTTGIEHNCITNNLPHLTIRHTKNEEKYLFHTRLNEILRRDATASGVKLLRVRQGNHEVDPIAWSAELISNEFAIHGPKMIEELFRKHMQNTTLNLYPTTSSSTSEKSTVDLQQQLYLNRKKKPQDQAVDPELWEILKAKFKKP